MTVDGIKVEIGLMEGRPFSLEQKDQQNSEIFDTWLQLVSDKLSNMELAPGLEGFSYLFEKYVKAKS